MVFVKEMLDIYGTNHLGIQINSDSWLVDKERNAYFAYTGGMNLGEILCFELHLEGQTTKIKTEELRKARERDNGVTKYDMVFNVFPPEIPESQLHRAEEIESLIKEGLEEFGFAGNKLKTASVTVNFLRKLIK